MQLTTPVRPSRVRTLAVLVVPLLVALAVAACAGGDSGGDAAERVRDVRPVEAAPVTLTRPDRGAVAFQIVAPDADGAAGEWAYRIDAARTACAATPEPLVGTVAPGASTVAEWDLTFEADCAASVPHLVADVTLARGTTLSTQQVLVYATADGGVRAACLAPPPDAAVTCRTQGATVVIGSAPAAAAPDVSAAAPPAVRAETVAAKVVVVDRGPGDDDVTTTDAPEAVFAGGGDNTVTVGDGDVVVGTGADTVVASGGFVDVADGRADDRVECTQADAVEVVADAGDVIVGNCVLDTTPDDPDPGPVERGLLGNYTVRGVITLDICTSPTCSTPGYPPQIENPTVTVTLTDGRNCTKDETGQGTYTVTANGFRIPLSFTARNEWDSTCSFLWSGATWRIEAKTRNGKLLGAGEIYMGQFGRSYFAGSDYVITCGSKPSKGDYGMSLFDDEGQLPPSLGCSRTKDLETFKVTRTK